MIIVIAVAVMCGLRYIPMFHFISSGFRVIIATVAGSRYRRVAVSEGR